MLGEVNAGIWRLLTILRRRRRGGKEEESVKGDGSSDSVAESSSSSSGYGIPGGSSVPDPGGASVRVATFNAALFAMAPVVEIRGGDESASVASSSSTSAAAMERDIRGKMANDRPKGILKQRSLVMKQQRSLRVSINLPDDEISSRSEAGGRSGGDSGSNSGRFRTKAAAAAGSDGVASWGSDEQDAKRGSMNAATKKHSVVEVLREVGADVVALQNVRAEEEKGMRPLSELAEGLGMPHFVFAESWAPEYGNAILSRWPIKRSWAQRVADESDFRNVLKATIEVPRAGELNLHCTHLDHLDESWRMKQVHKMMQTGAGDGPHILAGGLNTLDQDDYSAQRWADIAKYYEDMGKPAPKTEVMGFLHEKRYVDAKDFAAEFQPVVVVAKGQDVQGTCKYGTRVDYILASPDSPYRFVPGSYMVLSSKGTSDHHIVRVDVKIPTTPHNNGEAAAPCSKRYTSSQQLLPKPAARQQHIVAVTDSAPSKTIWS